MPETTGTPAGAGAVVVAQLRSIIERVERINEEKKALQDDASEIFKEAKGNGYDVPTLRAVIRLRAKDPAERQEHQALLDLYMHALGMLPDDETPEPPPPAAVDKGSGAVDLGAKRRSRQAASESASP
jgi:uncharacterized protein (UPF0335 family)